MIRSTKPFLVIKRKSSIYQGDASEIVSLLLPRHGRVVILTDENVARCHPELVGRYPHLLVGQGERAKSLAAARQLYLQFIELGVDRSRWRRGL